jgi:hypothetical protein
MYNFQQTHDLGGASLRHQQLRVRAECNLLFFMFSDLYGVGIDAVSVDAVTVHADHSLLTACLYVWVTTDSIACLLESRCSMTFAYAALDISQRKDNPPLPGVSGSSCRLMRRIIFQAACTAHNYVGYYFFMFRRV